MASFLHNVSSSAGGHERTPVPVHVYWRLIGPANRPVACTLYRTDTGLELRVERNTDDVILSDSVTNIHDATWKAEHWRFALVQEGMTELVVTTT